MNKRIIGLGVCLMSIMALSEAAVDNYSVGERLFEAIHQGNVAVVEGLISSGVNLDNVTYMEWSIAPLQLSAYAALSGDENRLKILQIILNNKAVDVNSLGQDGFTALYIAASNGRADAVQILLNHSQIKVGKIELTAIRELYKRGLIPERTLSLAKYRASLLDRIKSKFSKHESRYCYSSGECRTCSC